MVDALVEDDARRAAAPAGAQGGDGVGIAAFVAGCLALGPVAIILGWIGLRRRAAGRATRRDWPLAGLVLGIVGTLLVAGGAAAHIASERSDAALLARAEVDVVTIGNAVVAHVVAHPTDEAPTVRLTEDAYAVGDVSVPRVSTDISSVTIEGSAPDSWCVSLAAGADGAVRAAYGATQGLLEECPAT